VGISVRDVSFRGAKCQDQISGRNVLTALDGGGRAVFVRGLARARFNLGPTPMTIRGTYSSNIDKTCPRTRSAASVRSLRMFDHNTDRFCTRTPTMFHGDN